MTRTISAALFATTMLAACDETAMGTSTTTTDMAVGLPGPAQSTCMSAVAGQTGNANVTVLSEASSRGGSDLVIGVGESRAPWRCVTDSSGTVTQVMSMVGEGIL